MDQLLFHPKVVHLPIALAVLMPLIAGGATFAWWRGWFDRRVWVIVLLFQAALVGSALVAMNTGEAEEDRVEKVVAERYIDAHEEAAEAFLWASGIVLGVMVLPLLLPAGRLRGAAVATVCAGSLLMLGLGVRVGERGGELVYEHGAARAYTTTATGSTPGDEAPLPDEDADSDDD